MKKILTPQAFIFLGRSGCGKGTQAKLIIDLLDKQKSGKTLHIESGSLIREFSKGNSFTQKDTKIVMEKGLLIPEAVIVSLWMNSLDKNFTGQENIVFDGTPRKIREAQLLDDTLKFYNFEKINVVCVNVSYGWSENRLIARARKDDTPESIKKRLEWYETDVVPVINYYKDSPYYNVIDVNGEQPIEDVHKEILAKLGLNL